MLKPCCELPSITTASVMLGSANVGLMTYKPATGAWLMLNTMRSGATPLAVLLAAASASRKLIRPSEPRELARLAMDPVLPSATSLVVSTTMMPVLVAITFIANSEVSLLATEVAVALTRSPAFTQAFARLVLKAALPLPSVVTVVKPK